MIELMLVFFVSTTGVTGGTGASTGAASTIGVTGAASGAASTIGVTGAASTTGATSGVTSTTTGGGGGGGAGVGVDVGNSTIESDLIGSELVVTGSLMVAGFTILVSVTSGAEIVTFLSFVTAIIGVVIAGVVAGVAGVVAVLVAVVVAGVVAGVVAFFSAVGSLFLSLNLLKILETPCETLAAAAGLLTTPPGVLSAIVPRDSIADIIPHWP
jgi:hypothetical protein